MVMHRDQKRKLAAGRHGFRIVTPVPGNIYAVGLEMGRGAPTRRIPDYREQG